MRDAPNQTAVDLGEKIREAVEELKIENKFIGDQACVTVSIGVNTTVPDAYDEFKDFFDKADKALYTAKRSGRNKSVNYMDLEEAVFEQSLFTTKTII